MSLGGHKVIFLDFWKDKKIILIIVMALLVWTTYLAISSSKVIISNLSIGFISIVLMLYTIDIWKTLKKAAIVNKFSLYSSVTSAKEIIKLANLSNISTNTYFLLGSLFLVFIIVNKLSIAPYDRMTYIVIDYIYIGAILYYVQAKNYLNKYITLAVESSINDIKNKVFKGEKNEEK